MGTTLNAAINRITKTSTSAEKLKQIGYFWERLCIFLQLIFCKKMSNIFWQKARKIVTSPQIKLKYHDVTGCVLVDMVLPQDGNNSRLCWVSQSSHIASLCHRQFPFDFLLRRKVAKTVAVLQTAYKKLARRKIYVYEWFSSFKTGKIPIENLPHLERPSSSMKIADEQLT